MALRINRKVTLILLLIVVGCSVGLAVHFALHTRSTSSDDTPYLRHDGTPGVDAKELPSADSPSTSLGSRQSAPIAHEVSLPAEPVLLRIRTTSSESPYRINGKRPDAELVRVLLHGAEVAASQPETLAVEGLSLHLDTPPADDRYNIITAIYEATWRVPGYSSETWTARLSLEQVDSALPGVALLELSYPFVRLAYSFAGPAQGNITRYSLWFSSNDHAICVQFGRYHEGSAVVPLYMPTYDIRVTYDAGRSTGRQYGPVVEAHPSVHWNIDGHVYSSALVEDIPFVMGEQRHFTVVIAERLIDRTLYVGLDCANWSGTAVAFVPDQLAITGQTLSMLRRKPSLPLHWLQVNTDLFNQLGIVPVASSRQSSSLADYLSDDGFLGTTYYADPSIYDEYPSSGGWRSVYRNGRFYVLGESFGVALLPPVGVRGAPGTRLTFPMADDAKPGPRVEVSVPLIPRTQELYFAIEVIVPGPLQAYEDTIRVLGSDGADRYFRDPPLDREFNGSRWLELRRLSSTGTVLLRGLPSYAQWWPLGLVSGVDTDWVSDVTLLRELRLELSAGSREELVRLFRAIHSDVETVDHDDTGHLEVIPIRGLPARDADSIHLEYVAKQ